MSDRVSLNCQQTSYHGGAFFDAIGREFDDLERVGDVISADVLDAWFPPSPAVIEVLREHLSWAVGTSPPTESEGLVSRIAQTRGVSRESLLAGAGSSSLIFLALRHWLTQESRALVLDPSYGEYAHVLENVIGCSVDRLVLSRADGYQVDIERLERRLRGRHDLVVIVNPNNPTGRAHSQAGAGRTDKRGIARHALLDRRDVRGLPRRRRVGRTIRCEERKRGRVQVFVEGLCAQRPACRIPMRPSTFDRSAAPLESAVVGELAGPACGRRRAARP